MQKGCDTGHQGVIHRQQAPRCPVKCPMKGCKSIAIHLPRHLRGAPHNFKPGKIDNIMSAFYRRKQNRTLPPRQAPKYVDYHRYRDCPVAGCTKSVKRLPPHLMGPRHNIAKSSALFSELIIAARRNSRYRKIYSIDKIDEEELCGVSDNSEFETDGSQSDDDATDIQSDDGANSIQSGRDVTDIQSDDGANSIQSGRDVTDIQLEQGQLEQLEKDSIEVQLTENAKACEVVAKFVKWLTMPDGGLKNEKSARQHGAQISFIIASAGGEPDIVLLWDRDVMERFTTKVAVEKNFTPGTRKAYLGSVRHFYSYMLSEECDIDEHRNECIRRMKDRVTNWIAAYRKDSSQRELEKMEKDLLNLVTPENVHEFERSAVVLSAVKLIGSISDGSIKDLSLTEYTTARDFIATELLISNACRSGVLANMCVESFLEARFVDDQYIICVKDHKTSYRYGCARIILNAMHYSYLKVYVTKIRSQVADSSSKQVFLTFTGEKMLSGQITRGIQSLWKKAGMSKPITATIVRKTAVSSIHQNHPNLKDSLADLMCHQTTTAGKTYRLVQREKTSITAAKLLNQVMRSQSANASQGAPEADGKRTQEIPPNTPSRFMWNPERLVTLQSVFSVEINAHRSVSLDVVRERIIGTELAHIDPRKVYDKLRIVTNQVGLGIVEMPEPDKHSQLAGDMHYQAADASDADDSDFVTTTNITSRREIFSENEVAVIMDRCQEIIMSGSISQQRVKAALSGSPKGMKLLEDFDINQLLTRIKYERRKLSLRCTARRVLKKNVLKTGVYARK